MMLNWWLDFSITRRMCAGDDEFDEHSSLLIRWFADIELSSSRLHASLFKEELGENCFQFSPKKKCSPRKVLHRRHRNTLCRTPPRRKKMLTSMSLPSRATAAAKYSSASSRKTFGNANRSNASAFNNRNLAAARNASRKSRGQLVVSNGLFGLGLPEIVVIGGVTALLFGPSKLPELGKSLGKTVKSFQSAANEFNEELKKEVDEGNKDGEETKKEEE